MNSVWYLALGILAVNLILAETLLKKPKTHESKNEEIVNEAVCDTSHVTLLSFNTSDEEYAPALKDGWLYYIVNYDDGYSVFNVASSNSSDENLENTNLVWRGKSELKNVYLNFSLDGKEVLVNTLDKKKRPQDLYIGSSDDMDNISQLEEFPFNSTDYTIGRATISPDRKLLVFSSNQEGSVGGFDLWMCRFDGRYWGTPENIGAMVNTKKDEVTPFFASNTRLYFASNGHHGYGKYDLYYSDYSKDGFSEAVNMGTPVNSKRNEKGICFTPDLSTCYFASDRHGNYDIFSYHFDRNNSSSSSDSIVVSKKEETPVSVPVKENDITNTDGINEITNVKEVNSVSNTNNYVPIADVLNDENGKKDIEDTAENRRVESYGQEKIDTLSDENKLTTYSIQVIALTAKQYAEQSFRKILDPNLDYFIVKEDGWIKIRTGRFNGYKNAFSYAKEKGMDNYYVVPMNIDTPIEMMSPESSECNPLPEHQTPFPSSASPISNYTIQVLCLKQEEYEQQYFKKQLKPGVQYYIVREDDWVKVRTGNFKTEEDALKYAEDVGLKDFIVAPVKKGQTIEDI